jgi:hypothetical protein
MTEDGRQEGESERQGLSRRALITRGAVAGAVMWSAPLITSSKAFAADTTTLAPCAHYYGVRVLKNGKTHDLFVPPAEWPDPDTEDITNVSSGVLATPNRYGVCAEITQWRRDHPDINVTYDPSFVPQLVASPNHAPWIALLPSGPVPGPIDDSRLVLAYGRAGNLCCPAYVDPNPTNPDEAGRRLIFPSCHPNAQIHSLQIVYCAP